MSRIAITMGCPVSVGPEIIIKFFTEFQRPNSLETVVIGDLGVLELAARTLGIEAQIVSWLPGDKIRQDTIAVFEDSTLSPNSLQWGKPNQETGLAMASYIPKAVELIKEGVINGLATCPISKASLNDAGYNYPGHTEMLGDLTGCSEFVMMMAGSSLRVTLTTIHCGLKDIFNLLTTEKIYNLITRTEAALRIDFDIERPRIGVAGLNPHKGENGLFGDEEQRIISPAIEQAQSQNILVSGPHPPDTVFHQAANGKYDVVICMYHDQGLIPFKLLHFDDGVNVTLGLPIVRTSVDHGTAYDIAGKGIAKATSLQQAVLLADTIYNNRLQNSPIK